MELERYRPLTLRQVYYQLVDKGIMEMERAYVKIDVRTGREKAVRDSLIAIPAVKSADLTFGEQDIIVLIEAENLETLFNIVNGQIETINGVKKTNTNLLLWRYGDALWD